MSRLVDKMTSRRGFLAGAALVAYALLPAIADAQFNGCFPGPCPPLSAGGGVPVTPVVIDAIATVAKGAAVNTVSLNMTVGAAANAMRIVGNFGYSGHTGFGLTWTVGGTVQTMGVTANFGFLLTSDNGAAAPAIALFGLLNPTPGTGTLTMAWTGAVDNVLLQATSYKNVHTLGGLSSAFASSWFGIGTSNSAAPKTLFAIPGGIQEVFACGVAGTPSASWNVGTTIYSTSSGGITWGAAAYQSATATSNFTLGISASTLWAAATLVINAAYVLPTGVISVNGASPLATGLTAAIVVTGAVTLTDLISAATATPVGCTTDLSGGFGVGMAVPSGSTTAKADFGSVFRPIPNGDYTIVVIANPPAGGAQGVLVGQADAAVAGFACIETNSTDSSGQVSGSMSSIAFNGSTVQGADDGVRAQNAGTYHVGKADSGYHAFGGRLSGTTMSTGCDGAITTQNQIAVSGTFVNTNQHFSIGNLGNYVGGALSAGCTGILVLIWGRALSDADWSSALAQPMQVLA